jgi:predicted lipid-binding transport protein (Tim44 family)
VAFIRRRASGTAPALAGAGGHARSAGQVAWPLPSAPSSTSASERSRLDTGAGPVAPTGPAPVPAAFVPASFDAESFERVAKMTFIRLQAANDSANLDDLRQFTTPEMFAALKLDLLERGAGAQTTEVRRVEAKVLDVADEAERQVVSVRYRGEVVEAPGEATVAFDEVWHLVKPRGEHTSWAIAGIEQMA